jgi:hypothetical protein
LVSGRGAAEARIIAAGMTKEVTFEPVYGPINNRIDDAYRAKYHEEHIPQPDDRRPCAHRDSQGDAARDCARIREGTAQLVQARKKQ